jgi:hypothetical protein
MARIAQQIESFNLAFQLAWKHISEEQKHKQPNIARRLHDSIKCQIKEGQRKLFSLPPRRLRILTEANDAATF